MTANNVPSVTDRTVKGEFQGKEELRLRVRWQKLPLTHPDPDADGTKSLRTFGVARDGHELATSYFSSDGTGCSSSSEVLGWVDFDLGSSAVGPILPRQMGFWQNWLRNQAR